MNADPLLSALNVRAVEVQRDRNNRGTTHKSVDVICVFNVCVIGAKQLIKSISRTIRCVRRARE